MKNSYFILDKTNNDFAISSAPFCVIEDEGSLKLQMLRDLNFSGITEEGTEIFFSIISLNCGNNYDFVMKSNKFLEDYKNVGESIFNDSRYKKIMDIKYNINKENTIQEYLNATVRFTINTITKEDKELCYFSNPEITIR